MNKIENMWLQSKLEAEGLEKEDAVELVTLWWKDPLVKGGFDMWEHYQVPLLTVLAKIVVKSFEDRDDLRKKLIENLTLKPAPFIVKSRDGL